MPRTSNQEAIKAQEIISQIEAAYDQGRYFTVTGARMQDRPSKVVDGQRLVDWLFDTFKPVAPAKVAELPKGKSYLIDDDVIIYAQTAKNGDRFKAL